MSGILSYTGQVLVYRLQRSTKLPVKVAFNRGMSGEDPQPDLTPSENPQETESEPVYCREGALTVKSSALHRGCLKPILCH